MSNFLSKWGEAAYTSIGFFWMALWAFVLGYAISSLIQVFVSQERMKKLMGDNSLRSVSLGTFFGFISSSCSFSALATTKSLFQKGASFLSSMAFLLASTNLVIELGIVISIFLGWQFIAGEYIGGFLLIGVSWLLILLIRPNTLIHQARNKLSSDEIDTHAHHYGHDRPSHDHQSTDHMKKWSMVGKKYLVEWDMVWKDVTIGFTIAGIVAAFVPRSFFETLFIHTGSNESYSFFTLLEHTLVGPAVAFFTFIGSMGNIPLAALLFNNGVSFAGVMAFIFSDLVVFPVLRINAKYYGWKMSFFILLLLLSGLIFSSLTLHYAMDWLGYLPTQASHAITNQEFFNWDYTTFMNIGFLLISGVLVFLSRSGNHSGHHHQMAPKSKTLEAVLKWIAIGSYVWLLVGLIIHFAI